MPTITLRPETLSGLGVPAADLREPTLTGHVKRALGALLASRGFDLTRDIRVVELALGGFLLT